MAESDRIMARRRKKEKAERQAEQAELARVLALSPAQRERERKAGTVPMSPVMQAVKLYRASVPRGSWRRLNGALFGVVRGAIEGHIAFDETDVRDFYGCFDAACWLDAERLYEIAVKERNVSACRSVEHYCGRTPWLVKGQRLATGSALVWEDRKVVVTSFNDEADTFIACSYKVVRRGEGKRSYETDKVDRRFTVTREAFKQAFGTKKAKVS